MVDLDNLILFNDFRAADWLGIFHAYGDSLTRWATAKYQEAPALVFAVAIALALPVLALSGTLLRALLPRPEQAMPTERTVRTRPASLWRQSAFLEFTDSHAMPFAIRPGMTRIGRELDNDLCISDPTVHRYHAVLEQTPEAEFYISFVGDPDRDGLFVDGRPVGRQRLRGGEVLEIGAIKLRFRVSAA